MNPESRASTGKPSAAISPRTLAGRLAELCAGSKGQAPAIFYEHDCYTYNDLHGAVRRAANALLAQGVMPGDRVGVLMGNRPELVTLIYAASCVGATIVPLNTWYKHSELDFALRHCGISLLVFTRYFLKQDFGRILTELMPDLPRQVTYPALSSVVCFGGSLPGTLSWETFLDLGRGVDEGNMDRAGAQPDDIALVLYTSGSSADPKGVLLNHRNLLRNGRLMAERRNILASDRIWLGSPLFYGLGSANALPVALMQGAALVIQDHFDAGKALDIIERTEATGFYGTGNMARAILDHPNFSSGRVASLDKGNAGTTPQYKRMVIQELGVAHASSVYGLTESYGNATVSHHDDPVDVRINTCGTPLPGVEIMIADPDTFAPLPKDKVGLVLLRGRTAPGYLCDPLESRGAFLPDGWFNTGDLGSFDREDRFIFHSRLKEVIKCGGINVSPLEIEQLLITHSNVEDAHVFSLPDDVLGEVIVAYVTGARPVGESSLKAYVKKRAASFKVPHHILWQSEENLPRLASGKIDKRTLISEATRSLGKSAGKGDP